MNATPQNDLRHLFDGTHCLSKRQLRDYAASSMSREEAYAVESHLNSCPLCSAAVDGMLAQFPESGDMLATVDAGFLKEHFKKHSPQIHLNTVAPAAATPVTRRIPGSSRVIDLTTFRTVGIAAAAVLLIGSLWWFQHRDGGVERLNTSAPIAQAEERSAPSPSQGSSKMPEAERRLAQAAPLADARQQAGTGPEAEKKKSTEALLAEADAAVENSETNGAVAALTTKPAAAPAKTDAAATRGAVAMEDAAKSTTSQQPDDGRARRYERPLVDAKQPAASAVVSDGEIEKASTRSTQDVASTSAGAYRAKEESAKLSSGRAATAPMAVDGVMENGKALYKKGAYAAALKVFNKQLSATSGAQREEVMLYAARCHRALGQSAAAEKLLRNLADGRGANARAARRELRDMDAGYEAEGSRRASRRATGNDR